MRLAQLLITTSLAAALASPLARADGGQLELISESSYMAAETDVTLSIDATVSEEVAGSGVESEAFNRAFFENDSPG